MASQTGVLFRVSTFGESHGAAVGCTIDGCPAGLRLDLDQVQNELNRRRPGQSSFTSPRSEADQVRILSGVENGVTLGTPIALVVENTNAQASDYDETQSVYRPGHADYTYDAKFGIRARSGGGRASARETIGRVAAGAVAKQLLEHLFQGKIEVLAWVHRLAHIACPEGVKPLSRAEVDAHPLRVPHAETAAVMGQFLTELMVEGDTAGGLIRCTVAGVPAGWGEPVFDKLEADLAKAMMSLPASRSFEMGTGLAATFMKGSEHNDAFTTSPETGAIVTRTNHSGGVQGGISNGMELTFAVGFKPVSTIRIAQDTVDAQGNKTTLHISKGRHDPCVLPRAVPMVEAMTWLVLADHALRAQMNRVEGCLPR
ncbi:MAG: Chorismate synthase [Pseudomonadota bacterium]|jgi:chorismate synthase